MSSPVRRAVAPMTVVLVLLWIVSGCSRTASEEAGPVGTSGQASSAIGVQITPPFITVENRAEHPLVDMSVTIMPVRRSAPYTVKIPRMETGDKRGLSLGDFKEPNGAPINLNLVSPKEVVVTASDFDGKKYEVRQPWK